MGVSEERVSIINKIANLLAKADSTDFEHEAESARALAAKLMMKYEVKKEETETKEVIRQIIPTGRKRRNLRHASLMTIISRYCGVYMLSSGSNYIFCGKPEDIEATQYMFNVIWNQVIDMTDYWYEKNKRNPQVSVKSKNRYMYGLICGVEYNLDKINDHVFKYKQEQGLVPVNKNKEDYEKASDFAKKSYNVRQKKTSIVADNAYNQGMSDSEKIKMRKGVNNSKAAYALT